MSGLYIHIPFCEKKCIYCNFYSIEVLDAKQRFLNALAAEIDLRADTLDAQGHGRALYETVFLGGGTPSLLTPDELGPVMDRLRTRFRIAGDAEVTMECNPGTLAAERLQGYRALGVNRLSFGVQSFDDDELRFLSRIHSADQARRGIELARGVFENVSLDLIFALPAQTPERWRATLEEGVRLGTQHISAYSLIFEEGTRLNAMRLAGSVAPAEDTLEADMYLETMETLAAHGFEQYEVSNYARPGYECRHNVGYWERESYIAFGPSGHSFLRAPERSSRWANVSNLGSYLEAIEGGRAPIVSSEDITPGLAVEEIVFLGLRSAGVKLDEFRAVTGIELSDAAPDAVARMVAGGYARMDDNRLRLTRSGYPFADRLALELIAAIEERLPEMMSTGTQVPTLTLPVVRA